MNSYGTMPDNIRTTFKDSLRNQAAYDSAMKTPFGSGNGAVSPAAHSEGGSYWVFALIVFIISAIFSIFSGPEVAKAGAKQAGAEPIDSNNSGAGHDSGASN